MSSSGREWSVPFTISRDYAAGYCDLGYALTYYTVEGQTASVGIALANDSKYGLGSGIFTRDINSAWRFAREMQSGTIQINWTPLWRADLMPYGGFKDSGIGREGPRYALEEMTEIKTVVFHGIDR